MSFIYYGTFNDRCMAGDVLNEPYIVDKYNIYSQNITVYGLLLILNALSYYI